MDPGTLALLIPIVAILAGAYQRVTKIKADAAASLNRATSHLEDELNDAEVERDRLRRRIEALEAIVTSEGFDLEREARRAGITDAASRIDPTLLDLDDLGTGADRPTRRRTRDSGGR